MSNSGKPGIKPMTILKVVLVVIGVVAAIIIWDMPSRRGGGTVGDRVVGKAIAVGLLLLPVMAVGYLLNRRKKNDDDQSGGDVPARRE